MEDTTYRMHWPTNDGKTAVITMDQTAYKYFLSALRGGLSPTEAFNDMTLECTGVSVALTSRSTEEARKDWEKHVGDCDVRISTVADDLEKEFL